MPVAVAERRSGESEQQNIPIKRLVGHPISEIARQKIKDKGIMRYSSVEARLESSRDQGGIMSIGLVLFPRGASIGDVMEFTGESRKKVDNCLTRLRTSGFVKRPTFDEAKEAKSNAHVKKKKIPEEEKAIDLARKLIDSNLIAPNLEYWGKLQQIYAQSGQQFPALAQAIVTEVFFAGICQAVEGNWTTLNSFIQITDGAIPFDFEQLMEKNKKLVAEMIYKKEEFSISNESQRPQTQKYIFRVENPQDLLEEAGVRITRDFSQFNIYLLAMRDFLEKGREHGFMPTRYERASLIANSIWIEDINNVPKIAKIFDVEEGDINDFLIESVNSEAWEEYDRYVQRRRRDLRVLLAQSTEKTVKQDGLIQGLQDMGFPNAKIQRIVGISRPAVSKALRRNQLKQEIVLFAA